jgi:hypothetical protein
MRRAGQLFLGHLVGAEAAPAGGLACGAFKVNGPFWPHPDTAMLPNSSASNRVARLAKLDRNSIAGFYRP